MSNKRKYMYKNIATKTDKRVVTWQEHEEYIAIEVRNLIPQHTVSGRVMGAYWNVENIALLKSEIAEINKEMTKTE